MCGIVCSVRGAAREGHGARQVMRLHYKTTALVTSPVLVIKRKVVQK